MAIVTIANLPLSAVESASFRFPALRCFLEKHKYPLGTMNLRKFTWSLKFFKPPDTYKIEIITEIINAYPSRKYICVGDSGNVSTSENTPVR